MREVRLFIRDVVEGVQENPRQRIIAAVAFVLLALFVAFLVNRSGPAAKFAPEDVIEDGSPLQEVSVARTGRSGQPPHTELDLTNISSLVIAVDLDHIRDRAIYFQAAIIDFAGDEVFRDDIDETSIDEGRLLLQLERRHFPDGEYTLEIEGSDQNGIVSVLSRGTFQVTR